MTIVALKKQTGFNQDFEFTCFGGKYQVSNRTNSKQEKKNQDSVPPHMSFVKHFFTSSMLRYIMAQWKGPDPKARP